MLNLYRRHLKKCPHRGDVKQDPTKGRGWIKCSCPIWADGELNGAEYRKSLQTREWQRAIRKLAAIEDPKAPRVKPVAEAIAAFENHVLSLESSTQRKYKNVLTHLWDYCERAGVHDIMQLTVEHLDAFRAGRELSPTTSTKELQTLRQFCGFCLERKWAEENPAKKIRLPRNVKPEEVVPYTNPPPSGREWAA